MNASVEKQAVSPLDRLVFCPLKYRDVPLDRCRGCSRLVRIDDSELARYVVCDARRLDRRPGADASDQGPPRPR